MTSVDEESLGTKKRTFTPSSNIQTPFEFKMPIYQDNSRNHTFSVYGCGYGSGLVLDLVVVEFWLRLWSRLWVSSECVVIEGE